MTSRAARFKQRRTTGFTSLGRPVKRRGATLCVAHRNARRNGGDRYCMHFALG
jgi:hypothetical protein